MVAQKNDNFFSTKNRLVLLAIQIFCFGDQDYFLIKSAVYFAPPCNYRISYLLFQEIYVLLSDSLHGEDFAHALNIGFQSRNISGQLIFHQITVDFSLVLKFTVINVACFQQTLYFSKNFWGSIESRSRSTSFNNR
jgi:hypothetical protein